MTSLAEVRFDMTSLMLILCVATTSFGVIIRQETESKVSDSVLGNGSGDSNSDSASDQQPTIYQSKNAHLNRERRLDGKYLTTPSSPSENRDSKSRRRTISESRHNEAIGSKSSTNRRRKGMVLEDRVDNSIDVPFVPTNSSYEKDHQEKKGGANSVLNNEEMPLENLVLNLQSQLKQSQAAYVHTRSIINVLQEKQEAQESDLAAIKNEISELKREQSAQREILASIKTVTDDTSWAISSVKHTVDQTTSDLVALKHLQNQQNGTLLVVEEVIMNGAIESQTDRKQMANVKQELFQIRAELADTKEKVKAVENELTMSRRMKSNDWDDLNENNFVDEDQRRLLSNRLIPDLSSGPRPFESHRQNNDNDVNSINSVNPINSLTEELQESHHGRDAAAANLLLAKLPQYESRLNQTHASLENLTDLVAQLKGRVTQLSNRQSADSGIIQLHDDLIHIKFPFFETELGRTRSIAGNLTDMVAQLDGKVSLVSQKQMVDSELLRLQQSVINFTRQMYKLEEWRVNNAVYSDFLTVEGGTQGDADMAAVSGSLVNHAERIRALEEVVLAQKSTVQSYESNINQTLDELKETLEDLGRESYDRFDIVDDRMNQLEIRTLNTTLTQLVDRNKELVSDLAVSDLGRQISTVQAKSGEQLAAISRLESDLSSFFQKLNRHGEHVTSLALQIKQFGSLASEIGTMKKEINNFVLQLPSDCYQIPKRISPAAGESPIQDGVYLIRPDSSRHSARVYCTTDPDDRIWTVIQRRTDGREPFSRTWDEYRSGFGDADNEYWLGNDFVNHITDDGTHMYQLRIEMWDALDRYWLADYAHFRIHPEEALYRLEVGDYSGNATDSLRYSNLMPFSAPDRDNDVSKTHCAEFYQSGWWYKHCHYGNLNGRYTAGMVWFNENLDEWMQLRRTVMKIAPVSASNSDLSTAFGRATPNI